MVEKKVIEEETSIRYDETPIATYMEQVAKRVRAERRVAFTSLFDKTTLRSKIVGIFLAILELLRRQHFRAEQEEEFNEIWIMSPDDAANDDTDRSSPETDPD